MIVSCGNVNGVTQIFIIYNNHAKQDNIRQIIANQFIPSKIDKVNNAEISTPIILVEQMINSIPDEFWTKPQKVDGFDAVISNPPYQDTKGNNGTLWDKFVIFSTDTLNSGGYLLMIHPSGWRNADRKFKKAKKVILSRNLIYLKIHDSRDGVKTFGCGTRYDWYLLKNESVEKTNTVVRLSQI